MISVEFAPNETGQDALFALRILLQPWKWRRGKETTKLRQRLRKRFFSDQSDIHFFLTGRAALYNYLKSLQLEKDSEILVQSFTCEAVVLPILAQQLKPIYVDINEVDFSMNLADLKQKYTIKAKVLILQHTFAITPSERSKILTFAREKKLIVLEDLAHGFDPVLFNKKTQPTSLLLSFGRSKSLSGVFGGAIVTSNKKVSDNLSKTERNQQYPNTIFLSKMVFYKALTVLIKFTYNIYIGRIIHLISNYLHILPPEISTKEKKGQYDELYAKAFPNVSALFILQQLNRFNDVYRKKIQIAKYYHDKLGQSKLYSQAYLRYPFISNKSIQIKQQLKKKGIFLGSWYNQVVAPKELELKKVEYTSGSCPEAEKLTQSVINLPTFVTKKQAQTIIKYIKTFDTN